MIFAANVTEEDLPDDGANNEGVQALLSLIPVSYTHLDVYKRQGPASPSIGKINDIYRKVLYLKTEKYDTLVKMKNRLEQYIEINSGYQKIRIQFDFDPMHL